MLRKIFKYEWNTITPLLLVVHAVGLAVTIICRIGVELMGGVRGSNPSIMAALLLTAAIIAIGCVVFYTQCYIGYRFYKNVFAQQGYLTNTLPVTADELIWGKGLTGVAWTFLSILWCVAAVLILVCSPKELGTALRECLMGIRILFLPHTPAAVRIVALAVLLSPFFMIIQMYAAAAIGNLFTGHKLLASVAVYLGFYFLQQIVGLVMLFFMAPYMNDTDITFSSDTNGVSAAFNISGIISRTVILALLFSVACSVVFYFLCRYVLNHRMNLE